MVPITRSLQNPQEQTGCLVLAAPPVEGENTARRASTIQMQMCGEDEAVIPKSRKMYESLDQTVHFYSIPIIHALDLGGKLYHSLEKSFDLKAKDQCQLQLKLPAMTPIERSKQGKAITKDEQNFSALPPSLMQKGTGQLVCLKNRNLASTTAECSTFPIDLTKTWLQIQGQKNDANFKEIRAAIVGVVELLVYDLTKKHLILSGLMGDTVYTHFLSGFTCGLAGALASNPVNVVRTCTMNQSPLR
ncbi:hypothetical protein MJG53_006621 [Ovis ammon polii x Ovis aries]|uniref:Uncharacterized protein n=2 Tax=Ovis TaxID=9935 RepID=A0A836D2K0_SHEEP|nr:hypothetical protein JEQ12_015726 [Ovis aries]KAI4585087.1 hypothetical protein MJG53_006621 [Ovis ammon polii x Ovis aries]